MPRNEIPTFDECVAETGPVLSLLLYICNYGWKSFDVFKDAVRMPDICIIIHAVTMPCRYHYNGLEEDLIRRRSCPFLDCREEQWLSVGAVWCGRLALACKIALLPTVCVGWLRYFPRRKLGFEKTTSRVRSREEYQVPSSCP